MTEETRSVQMRVNGASVERQAIVRQTLADFLRDELRLTGTHLGCEHGVCGACTVLLDGEAVRACIMLAVQADGCAVTTVEGLADGETLTPLQQAFHRNHALQCGFCTPGLLMTATAYLNECRKECQRPDDEAIRIAISGNICRCTGYSGIVRAIAEVAAQSAV